jgi:membrane-associated phospholipid phosphatase
MVDRNIREDSTDIRTVDVAQEGATPAEVRNSGLVRRLFAFVGRLFERLGAFYLLGLVIALMALVAFGWLANEVLEERLRPLNESIMLGLHGYADPMWDPIARGVTDLGSVIFVTIIGLAVGGLFVVRRRMLDAATLGIVLIGGGILSTVLKVLFQQQRPRLFPTIIPLPPDYSFPSGHSLISFCLYGFLAAWLLVEAPREIWRWPAALFLLLVAAAVALSRLYLGVHWPSDVTAGMLIATFWVSFCMTGRAWWFERARRKLEV